MRPHRCISRITRTAALVAVVLALVASAGLLPGTASAQDTTAARSARAAGTRAWSSFAVAASATAIGIDSDIPGAAADDHLASADVSRAAAVVDGLGRSDAQAAAIAPGDSLRSLRGIAAGLVAGAVPVPLVPDVPLMAESSHPTVGDARAAAAPVELRAESGPSESKAAAGWTTTASSALSTATTSGGSDEVLEAVASVDVTGFSAGPVSVGRLRATASAVGEPGGGVRRHSEMELTGLTVAGQPVRVGPRDPFVTDAVTIRYLAAQETDDRVDSPAIAVTLVAPGSLIAGAPSTVTFTIGRATASIRAVRSLRWSPAVPTTVRSGDATRAAPRPRAVPVAQPAATTRPAASARPTGTVRRDASGHVAAAPGATSGRSGGSVRPDAPAPAVQVPVDGPSAGAIEHRASASVAPGERWWDGPLVGSAIAMVVALVGLLARTRRHGAPRPVDRSGAAR